MLTHYIFVRKDLPLGILAAMVTHAAGESGARYQDEYDGRFRGATAVVLEAENEAHLNSILSMLVRENIEFAPIHENGAPYHNQLMAIGLVPLDRYTVVDHLREFKLLTKCLDNGNGGSV